MNYQVHYDRLIERARNRSLEGYVERHHVIPKCMKGTNDKDNIVLLTPEEHYVAHQLLLKLHPHIPGLAYAAIAMCGKGKTISRNNKSYGWIKQRVSAARKGKPLTAATKLALSKSKTGKALSQDHKLAISEGAMGKKRKACSTEHKKAISQGAKGIKKGPMQDQQKLKISLALVGKTKNTETKEKMRLAWIKRRMEKENAFNI